MAFSNLRERANPNHSSLRGPVTNRKRKLDPKLAHVPGGERSGSTVPAQNDSVLQVAIVVSA